MLTAGLVVLWGLGHRLYDTLTPLFAEVFGLTGFKRTVTDSIYNIVYIFGALPAAFYARRFGYKAAILLGLGVLAAGAFTLYPASGTRAYPFYVFAVSAMATGWLILEIAANPFFVACGSLKHGVFRLNLAQSLYPIGALAGITIGHWLMQQGIAVPRAGAAFAIGHPYIVVGAAVLLIAFLIEEAEYPPVAHERIPGIHGLGPEITSLLRRPLILFAMAAQLAGILAVGVLWVSGPAIILAALPVFHTTDAVFWWCTILFAAGRFLGTALMWKVHPGMVLAVFSAVGVLCALTAALAGGRTGAIALLILNICLSITWPTILGLALTGLRRGMKTATALLALSGALGGIFYKLVSPAGGLSSTGGFVLAALCCTVITLFALSQTAAGRFGLRLLRQYISKAPGNPS